MSETIEEESWNRYPDARIRMRENGLKTLLEGLGENGFCRGTPPRIFILDDGIYVEFSLNVGEHGSIVALPFEVFLPVKFNVPAKKKKSKDIEDEISVKVDSMVEVSPIENNVETTVDSKE